MNLVIKRNGTEVPFDEQKIASAIKKAGFVKEPAINKIIENIKYQLSIKGSLTVEEIQDLVELGLMTSSYKSVAREYIRYRKTRELIRENEKANESILKLIDDKNEYLKTENSNKNHAIASTQRDYIAGEVSKDISMRLLLPTEVVEAHKKGVIHFHDADYFIQHIHNCFSSATKFVTDTGVRAFKECYDGEKVNVLDKDGIWQTATVRKYGKQTMQYVTLQSGRTVKTIKCTPNHRWVLKDGSVTTALKEGDRLFCLQEKDVTPVEFNEYFCLGFILGDGTDCEKDGRKYWSVRLCGEKNKYTDVFLKNGFSQSGKAGNDFCFIKRTKISKQDFLTYKMWNLLRHEDLLQLFLGLYAADGAKDRNMIATADARLVELVQDISAIAGYHITRCSLHCRDTNFKKNAELYEIGFMRSQPGNRNWVVKSIELDKHTDAYDAWCVEEPVTHTFTLDGGVVTGNCCLVNLEDILQNGTVINGTLIEKPHSFSTACNIATQVAAIIASNQYGGQTMSLAHLAPFVEISRQRIKQEAIADGLAVKLNEEALNEYVEEQVKREITRGVQTIQYQINTLNSSNGQTPFITIFAYLNEAKNEQEKKDLALVIAEVLRQRIQGVKNEVGHWISPAFPKIIYALEEDNIHEDSKYWWLTELAAKCTAKRLVPDYISEKKMIELKGYCFPSMGCRSFLSPWFDKDGKAKFYGRFNQGVCTINLPYVALLARDHAINSTGTRFEDPETTKATAIRFFWDELDHYAELCHKALQARHARLLNTPVETSPLHWMYGALSRHEKGTTINDLLFGGYSSISLGYAGLYECVQALIEESHTTEKGRKIALEILKKLNDYCEKWKKEEDLGYSIYGTPIESTTYKFAKALKEEFGEIPEVSDHDYITNSYHVNVREAIDPFTKLTLEEEFQELSLGGCISYVETANLQNNIPAVLEVIKFIYDNIMYAELNTKSDYCQICGSTDEIKIVEDNGKLVWECPHCGNKDQSKMNVTRRTCGYLGSNFWNQGRTEEIRDRFVHLGSDQQEEI